IETLFAGASTAGERLAAKAALERVRTRLAELGRRDPPIEMQFAMPDRWSRHLFLALCRRYGLAPYRYHAGDDVQRLVKGDPGVEIIYLWTKEKKGVNRRGAGPIDAKLLGRGAGEGFGVHICTGPVYIHGAEPGDILEVRIMDVKPRPCANPAYAGKSFGSNAAAWWGCQYKDLITDPNAREVCTIYEIDTSGQRNWAQAVYNFRWTPQTDPFGVVHKIIDYPGVPVDHSTVQENHSVLKNVRIPIRPHFGVMGVAPKEADI